MAERRMFAKTIIDSDAFLDMPISARLLYYDLGMRADDDGFVNSPKKIMKMVGASTDDMNVLILRKFIIPFESGIVVIKHWKIHNYIQSDRYRETNYKTEKSLLALDENKAYKVVDTECIQSGYIMDTQVRLGKDSIGKDSIDNISPKESKKKYGEYKHVLLTDKQLNDLKELFTDWQDKITNLDEYIETTGKSYKNHYLVIVKWAKKNDKSKLNKAEEEFLND
jgi:hypothetical protein